jgi:hypothetical protein
MVMLASDVNNPEFANPQDPDALLHVEFYWHEPISKWQSEVQGKEVRGKKIPFVRIMKPGDQTSILETAVRDDHKARWPKKWMAWQMREGLIEGSTDVPGWKIEEWPAISKDDSKVQELKYLRFSTVEQLAGASDAQIQRLGIGGIGLREQARAAIKERNRSEYKAEMDAKDKQIADMVERLAKLESLLPISGKDTLHVPKKGA